MRIVRRIAVGLAVVIVTSLVVVSVAGVVVVRRSFPTTEGTVGATGLGAAVTV